MHAQITWFDGPRSEELVAAGEFAGRHRLAPAVLSDPQCAAEHVATYVLRSSDGGELAIAVARTEAMLDRAGRIILGTQLLPGEDPALLPGPDRVTRHQVVFAAEHGSVVDLAAT